MVLVLEEDFPDWDEEVGTPLLSFLYVPLFFLSWFFQFVCD